MWNVIKCSKGQVSAHANECVSNLLWPCNYFIFHSHTGHNSKMEKIVHDHYVCH